MDILQLFLLIILLYIVWNILSFLSNYRTASRIGLPLLVTPVDPTNVIWILCSSWLEPFLRSILPSRLSQFVECNSRGWNYDKIHSIHAQMGDSFSMVSPKQLRVFIANAQATEELTKRRRDFVKPVALYKPLQIFGSSVVTTEGEDWLRHRRITTPPFSERNSKLVWNESRRQAKDMLRIWLENEDGITNPQSDTMVLALHVLTAAGFGRSYTFGKGLESPAYGHCLTYRDALSLILGNLFTAIFAASVKVPIWILPGKLRQVREAVEEFRRYMHEMVDEERASINRGREEADNLMSIVVRASEESKTDGKGKKHLSDEEIYGNLFSYNLAGHETTSNTLAYAITLLAAKPEWQEWVGKEIDRVMGCDDLEDIAYEEAFPKLKRCLALMHETLRLFGSARAVPKYTLEQQTLKINQKTYTIPKHTFIAVNLAGLHTNPHNWENPLDWLPNRWIADENRSSEEDVFAHVPTGAFLPWSGGPRVCPGRKFSQVEFVAVIASILRHHRIQPIAKEGESLEQAASCIVAELVDSSFNFLLKVKHPERIRLGMVKRKDWCV